MVVSATAWKYARIFLSEYSVEQACGEPLQEHEDWFGNPPHWLRRYRFDVDREDGTVGVKNELVTAFDASVDIADVEGWLWNYTPESDTVGLLLFIQSLTVVDNVPDVPMAVTLFVLSDGSFTEGHLLGDTGAIYMRHDKVHGKRFFNALLMCLNRAGVLGIAEE